MNLADGLREQMERCRAIQESCREIGPSGNFLYNIIKNDIVFAQRCILTGDVVGMLKAYNSLKGYKE